MPPAFTAALAENIEKKCGRPSGEGKDGEILEPGHVYVAPGDKHMVLEQDGDAVRVRINEDPPENFCRPSADPLFRSAAGIFGAKILVTVLTGMGSDGEAGSRKIAEAGGTVIAQNEETSVVWGVSRAVQPRFAVAPNRRPAQQARRGQIRGRRKPFLLLVYIP